jgi:hypothetical protein
MLARLPFREQGCGRPDRDSSAAPDRPRHGVRPRKLVRLAQVFTSPLKRLLANHGAPIALHRSAVRGEQLRRHHPFKLIFRSDADHRRNGGAQLPITRFLVGVLEPQGLTRLIGEQVVPVVRLRSANSFQGSTARNVITTTRIDISATH